MVCWREFGLANAYTMEASFGGAGHGRRRGTHFSPSDYEALGRGIGLALLRVGGPGGPVSARGGLRSAADPAAGARDGVVSKEGASVNDDGGDVDDDDDTGPVDDASDGDDDNSDDGGGEGARAGLKRGGSLASLPALPPADRAPRPVFSPPASHRPYGAAAAGLAGADPPVARGAILRRSATLGARQPLF